jgi:thiol-disulfide isomerase/thioredoxin
MDKHTKFLLSLLCLSSLVLTVSCSATKSDNTSQNQVPPSTSTTKVDPGAGKLTSVGEPLAKELQGKPVLVDVYATWCPSCKNIAPTLSQLKQEYSGKVNFVVLDVTDKAKIQETQAQAEKLGLGKFLEDNKSKTSTVAIFDPATGNILTVFKNNPNKADYTKILDTALAKN